MEDTDILSLQEKLKKERIKKTLLQRKSLVSLSAITLSIPVLTFSDTKPLELLSVFVAGYGIKTIIECYKKQKELDFQEIDELLRKTKSYEEITKEYNRYLDELVQLIKSYGFASSKETILYLSTNMKQGYYSKNMSFRAKQYEHANNHLSELSGAKVLSSQCTSYQAASFIKDVMDRLGYTSAIVESIITTHDPVTKSKERNLPWNNALNAICEDGEMYYFNPVKATFATTVPKLTKKEKDSKYIRRLLGFKKSKYIILNPESRHLNLRDITSLDRINSSKETQITEMELMTLRRKIGAVVLDNSYTENHFFIKHERTRRHLEELHNTLCPKSDEPIKKWLVK